MSSDPSAFSAGAERLAVDAVRILSMDAVEKARSGHPGTPMALAPLCYVLWTRHLRHDPKDPRWPDRDRFVLSCGHASMLLYSLLHLSGYDLTIEDLKEFRQWGSRTPGHPEYGHTPGVETTTGPLGQGFANAVGMALAEARLASRMNRTGFYVVDHHTWFLASDGDLMEGISHEAASLAGHLRLGKLIGFYDDNGITIEGDRALADSEDVSKRFEAYGWQVLRVEDGNDLDALDDAIEEARAELRRPSLVIVRTEIAYGCPEKQGTAAAHGAPLGEAEILGARERLGWPSTEPFFVPEEARVPWRRCLERGADLHAAWVEKFREYEAAYPDAAEEFERLFRGGLPEGWEEGLPDFGDLRDPLATRQASGGMLQALHERIPELVGGSADLGPSNCTLIREGRPVTAADLGGDNLHFGIREHAMASLCNGMALHGGVRPYAGTFLVFADYMRPAIRMAALMGLPVIYVCTHDSIGLGEDGPTHQPIETLASLRAIPNLVVIRPADAVETAEAWRVAIRRREGPTLLALSRQKLPPLVSPGVPVHRGAYVCRDAGGEEPALVLLASGSELRLCLEAAEILEKEGIAARVLSVPSLDLLAAQDEDDLASLLPPGVPRLAVEAAHPMPWHRWVEGRPECVLGIERFGASAPAPRLFEEFGFTAEAVAARGRALCLR